MGPGYLLQPAKEICLPLQFEENLHMLHKFDTIAQYHVVDQFSSILNELCLMFLSGPNIVQMVHDDACSFCNTVVDRLKDYSIAIMGWLHVQKHSPNGDKVIHQLSLADSTVSTILKFVYGQLWEFFRKISFQSSLYNFTQLAYATTLS